MSKSTSNVKVLQTIKQPPAEELIKTEKSSNQITISPRKPVDVSVQENSKNSINLTKKVYLSDGQSKLIGGIPGAPPATPFPGKMYLYFFLLFPPIILSFQLSPLSSLPVLSPSLSSPFPFPPLSLLLSHWGYLLLPGGKHTPGNVVCYTMSQKWCSLVSEWSI